MTRAMTAEGDDLWTELRELALEQALPHEVRASWSTDEAVLPEDGTLECSRVGEHRTVYIFALERGAARVEVQSGWANIFAVAATPQRAQEVIERARELQPPAEPAGDMVEVSYWAYGQHGPKCAARQIAAPTWEEVQGNYRGKALAALEAMMADFDPGVGGQLLLWSGTAGTGKTTALRALAREWKGWCSLHYITDPDKFFGAQADYLLDVALNETSPKVGSRERPPWRLLVLEDSGELMRKDAAEVTGKALSRLLNTVDGMIGQGLRIMVLVTTNEELGKLHEAIARPGRCAVQIEFDALSGDEAEEWRQAHGITHDERPFGEATLAELYAELEGFRTGQSRQPVGFGAA